jgi:hypothetical protein
MQYRLRTLLILLAVGPPMVAMAWWAAMLGLQPIFDPLMAIGVLCLAAGYSVAIALFLSAFTAPKERARARLVLLVSAGLAAIAPAIVYLSL